MRSWCAYQERSQHETQKKLFEFGLDQEDAEQIVAALIGENFLNEERFAVTFASGKFRIKRWGKNRIKMELRQHRISDYSINKALRSIDADEYDKTMAQVIEKKLRTVKAGDSYKQFHTVRNYLVSRGFESDLVTEQLKTILQNNDYES